MYTVLRVARQDLAVRLPTCDRIPDKEEILSNVEVFFDISRVCHCNMWFSAYNKTTECEKNDKHMEKTQSMEVEELKEQEMTKK